MRVAEFCICGMSFVGYTRNSDEAAIKRVLDLFWSNHQGEGHGRADRKTAVNARRRAQAKADREYLEERRRLR